MTTKIAFCEAYEASLRRMYEWARDENKLAKFMLSVERTLDGENTWNRSGDAYDEALRIVGLPRRITLKALQALPVGEPKVGAP